jgi:hypothetical protein
MSGLPSRRSVSFGFDNGSGPAPSKSIDGHLTCDLWRPWRDQDAPRVFDAPGVARVSWWWNGNWGRLARRDAEIHHVPESWSVEARQGGPGGEGKGWAAASEDEARKMAE